MNNKKYSFKAALSLVILSESIIHLILCTVGMYINYYVTGILMLAVYLVFAIFIYGKWFPNHLKSINIKKQVGAIALLLVVLGIIQILFAQIFEWGMFTMSVNPLMYISQFFVINLETMSETVCYIGILIGFIIAVTVRPLCFAVSLKNR